MNERTLTERLNLPWPEHETEEVTLPAWVLELCAEAATTLVEKNAELAAVKAYSIEMLHRKDEQFERAERAEARVAELEKAMELARAVLAQSITAGHNVPGPTPEDIEKAFWALDDALSALEGDKVNG